MSTINLQNKIKEIINKMTLEEMLKFINLSKTEKDEFIKNLLLKDLEAILDIQDKFRNNAETKEKLIDYLYLKIDNQLK